MHIGVQNQLTYSICRVVDELLFLKGRNRNGSRFNDGIIDKCVYLGQDIKQTTTECTLVQNLGAIVITTELNILQIMTRDKRERILSEENHGGICRPVALKIEETD